MDAHVLVERTQTRRQTPAGPQRRRWKRAITTIAAATAAMWAVSALALFIYTANARAATTHTLEIPAGTNELIAAGQNPLEIPSTWSFLADDLLVLVNDDGVDHWLGQYFVAADTTARHVLRPSLAGFAFCSLHPGQGITIDVEIRTFDWRQTVPPTLAFGPLLGLVVLGSRRVMRLIDQEPEARDDNREEPT